MGDSHIAQLHFGTQNNNVNNLQCKFSGIKGGGDIICDKRDVERAKMRDLWQALQEMMLPEVRRNTGLQTSD
jgi:hypothetical protein